MIAERYDCEIDGHVMTNIVDRRGLEFDLECTECGHKQTMMAGATFKGVPFFYDNDGLQTDLIDL